MRSGIGEKNISPSSDFSSNFKNAKQKGTELESSFHFSVFRLSYAIREFGFLMIGLMGSPGVSSLGIQLTLPFCGSFLKGTYFSIVRSPSPFEMVEHTTLRRTAGPYHYVILGWGFFLCSDVQEYDKYRIGPNQEKQGFHNKRKISKFKTQGRRPMGGRKPVKCGKAPDAFLQLDKHKK